MKDISLLVLAAGLGSRYKGQKQVDGVGSHKETLMEFALYDAINSGIKKFIFIINDQFPESYQQKLKSIFTKNDCVVYFVKQTLDKFIPDEFLAEVNKRHKPLGTAHAVYCAKDIIKEPFITINADDFYGASTFQTAVDMVNKGQITADKYGMVAFKLTNTLSDNGTVSRGVCTINEGKLQSVREFKSIQKNDNVINGVDDETKEPKELSQDTLVSMNFWILHPSFLDFAQRDLLEFLKENDDLSKIEFYLPSVVDKALRQGEIEVEVAPTHEKWFGLTYHEDKETTVKALSALKSNKVYPKVLWA